MSKFSHTAATVLLAGGRGSRMNGVVEDKILWKLNQKPVIQYSLESFASLSFIVEIVIVVRDKDQENCIRKMLPNSTHELDFTFCIGGEERQNSVFNGICASKSKPDQIFIHDSARPLLRPCTIKKMYQLLHRVSGTTLAHRLTDSIKRAVNPEPTQSPSSLVDVNRSALWAMETPQAFHYDTIKRAYQRVMEEKACITDDNAAFELLGEKIQIVENTSLNPKITYPQDLSFLEYIIKTQNETN
jgi:2-C-methyl-D-erythritol 4-phosphate cytidylyltransferase